MKHLGSIALAMLSAPAIAQVPDPAIVVTGQRLTEDAARTGANAFVRKISAFPVEGQYARWNEPVCPKIVGVEPAIAARVAAKIVRTAERVGAPGGGGKCRANLIVTFAGDAKALVGAMMKRSAFAFANSAAAERTALRESDAAVRWWYGIKSEGADGNQISHANAALLGSPDFSIDGRAGGYLDSYKGSLVDSQLRVKLTSVSVVVDVTRATGFDLDSVAAYVAFVGLARTRMGADSGGTPSILGLFAGTPETGPRDLTEWDLAYLTALYKVPANRAARMQRSMMVGEIVKRLSN